MYPKETPLLSKLKKYKYKYNDIKYKEDKIGYHSQIQLKGIEIFDDLDDEDYVKSVDTNGLSKYSDEYFAMSYVDIMKLITCVGCKKVYNKNMAFGSRLKGLCYHCLILNLPMDYFEKDPEIYKLYISKCEFEHISLDCERGNCFLCKYKKGDIKFQNKKNKLKILI